MVFNNNLLLGAGGQTTGQGPFDPTLIGNSAWYDGSSDYMNSPSFSAQADPTCFIFATWIQLLDFSIGSFGQYLWSAERPSNYASIRISNTNKLIAYSNPGQFESSMLFRDIGWYHIICSYKGPDDTIRMFVNGNEITVTKSNSNTLASNLEPVHASHTHRIGAYFSGATGGTLATAKSYMAQTVFLDGFSFQDGDVTISDFLDTQTFGTNGSQFIPKKNSDLAALAGTAGANSYVIDYADSSNLGNDISSKNNNFTLVSMDSENQSVHTPSLQFPILNALNGDSSLISNLEYGNRLGIGTSNWDSVFATKSMGKSGKYYYETRIHFKSGSNGFPSGIHEESTTSKNWAYFIGSSTSVYGLGYALYGSGSYYTNGTENNTLGASTFSTGDIINTAVDLDNNKIWWGLNGTYFASGNPSTNTNGVSIQADTEYVFGISPSIADDYFVNFGQDSTFGGATTAGGNTDANGVGDFKYTVPTGFQCLASSSLTAPDYQGIDYFDTTLYEGNGDNQRVGDFVPFTDTFAIGSSAMWYSEDIRRLAHTYSSEATATSDDSSDLAVYRKATISFWVKFVETSDSDQQVFISQSNSGQTERFIMYAHGTDDFVYVLIDPSGSDNNRQFRFSKGLFSTQNWSNVVINLDTNNSTAADRMKIWINGNSITSTETSRPYTNMAQGQALNLFRNEELMIGHLSPGSTYASVYNFNSYLAEYHVIDGYAKAPSDFGQVDTSTNRWVPKDYKTNVGTYGNRGFYLKFDGTPGAGSGSDMGKDSSGNNIHLTEEFGSGGSAWATTDKFADTPSKNFVTFDTGLNAMGTLSEGGTKIATTTNNKLAYTTMNIPSTGKWYWEVDMTSYASGGGAYFGLHEYNELNTGNAGVTAKAVIFQNYNGTANVYDSSNTDVTWCNSVSNNGFVSSGDVLQFALDQDAGTLFIGNNNTWFRAGGARDTFANATTVGRGTFPTGISRRFFVGRGGSFAETYALNFGQQANTFSGSSTTFNAAANGFFVYTPPTGYKALNQDNLDDTASKITAWAWIKNRDASSDHMLFDRVRGIGKDLHSNSTAAEATNANTVQRFLQRGVQVGNDSTVNTAGNSFVLWQWLLGDSATTGSTNTDGSVNTTVIAADAGHFSVVKGTTGSSGATFGHGLGAAPDLIINKNLTDGSSNWLVYNSSSGATFYLGLNLSSSKFGPGSTIFGTEPDSTVFTLGSFFNSVECINYCLRSVPGVCKVGVYQVNNTTDKTLGPYVSLGFKPRWIMFKGLDNASQWTIYDTGKEPFNVNDHIFQYANLQSADQAFAANDIDMLSDGFKIRTDTNNEPNNGSGEYLYVAMADIAGNGTLPPIYGR